MSKVSKNYVVIWAAMLALFNLIVFISPGWDGTAKYTGAFWVAYAITTVVFFLHLALTLVAFKDAEGSNERLFLNIPIIRISYISLIVTIIAGTLCMLNSFLPAWVAAIVMSVLLAVYIISIVKTKIAIEVVEQVVEKVQVSTSFIKEMRVDSSSLVGRASPASKDICNKVAEALKYSDPVSNDTCAPVEIEMRAKLDEFATAVKAGEDDKVSALGNELLDLIEERNKRCKAGK